MKMHIYLKLAFEGIRKNKRLYLPYILTGSVMVMMYYILSFLVESPSLSTMQGGYILKSMLPLGNGIIGIFSMIFLFYTNSFLIRQRNKEFGLYNILGMNKRNISYIMLLDNIIVAVFSIVSGLIFGIVLSKLAEVSLLNILHFDVSYQLSVGTESLRNTALIYIIIYLLLLFNSLIKVWRSKPLELLHSNKVGEKPPRANWLFAIIGVLFLGVAYYFAISIEDPLTALTVFFVAVILVIVATYLLFIAGSVVLCRILQKNKSFYYKPNHFLSVSSMVYRMKRNGAGLASICILSTMVLVMISSTASLYIGAEDTIRARYPYDISVSVNVNDLQGFNQDKLSAFRTAANQNVHKYTNIYEYCTGEISGLFTEGGITVNVNPLDNFSLSNYEDVGTILIIPLNNYNNLMNSNETLKDDECMIYCTKTNYVYDTFAIDNGKKYNVKKVLDDFFEDGNLSIQIMPTICLVVKDFDTFVEPILKLKDYNGNQMIRLRWKYCFDMNADAETELNISNHLRSELSELDIEKNHIESFTVESREARRKEFFNTFGSLFFLGIMLSIVFIFAAVLIIYYKQISEGYEDQSRFDIMQKVGMTKKDIQKSINSQILMVFFLPLLFAGLHLAFAFPIVWKLLQLFTLQNLTLVIIVTIVCFLIFGLFYALVYKLTAGAYYNIVSGAKEK